MAKRKLGRGLDMLIAPQEEGERRDILEIDPTVIQPNPRQPRQKFAIGELENLRNSIAREGILQPLLVRKIGSDYQLVAGERRLRAARDLGLETVPVIVVDVPDDRLLELALIENVQREDLNPIELAQAYRTLMGLKNWSQEELAESLGLSRPAVGNTVRLLDLPDDMQGAVVRGQITQGHAKVLLSITDPKEQRLLFERIAEEKLSVRELELARNDNKEPSAGRAKGRRRERAGGDVKKPYLVSLEEELAERLGTRVRIRERGGKGVLSIEFYSQDDFDRLRRLLTSAAAPSPAEPKR